MEDLEELNEYRGRKRKEFEDRIRYSRSSVSISLILLDSRWPREAEGGEREKAEGRKLTFVAMSPSLPLLLSLDPRMETIRYLGGQSRRV